MLNTMIGMAQTGFGMVPGGHVLTAAQFFTWWRDTGAGEVIHDALTASNNTLGDIPGGWVPQIQQMMGLGGGPPAGG